MSDSPENDWIYDWNEMAPDGPTFASIEVDDETLRDGLQSPSVREPTLDEKLAILEAMMDIGIRRGDIGLPMSSQLEDIRGLLRHIVEQNRPFAPGLAVRTVLSDLQHVADLQQEFGIPIKAEAFLGCSRIRQMVEGWDLNFLLARTVETIEFAKSHDMPVMFVTEDTTRAHPDDLRAIYGAAVEAGADEICIADTVGHATPWGAAAVVRMVRSILKDHQREEVLINWHGHSDRGLAVINSLAAADAGADILHAAGIGIGERSGNTAMDQLLVNLKLMDRWDPDLSDLPRYVKLVSAATETPIPMNYPVFGEDAFRTATGVHAAAIAKAQRTGHAELADVIYSGVPAHMFGLAQRIEIGRMSGKSNVLMWLDAHAQPTDEGLVTSILTRAHASRTILGTEEIMTLVEDWRATR